MPAVCRQQRCNLTSAAASGVVADRGMCIAGWWMSWASQLGPSVSGCSVPGSLALP